MRRGTSSLTGILFVTISSCSSEPPMYTFSHDGEQDVVTVVGAGTPLAPATTCEVTTASAVSGSRVHVDTCSSLAFDTIPPSHGDHYPVWPAFRIYEREVPWGFLVHGLEHGAVIIGYDCTGITSCDELVASLRAFYDATDADPRCGGTSARARLILAPVRGMGAPVVASAWGFVYRATCFDETSLRDFVTAHYGRAPEQLCNAGASDPTCS